MNKHGAPLEWYRQEKTKVLGEKPVPVPICSPQIPHGHVRDLTRNFAKGRTASKRLRYDTDRA